MSHAEVSLDHEELDEDPVRVLISEVLETELMVSEDDVETPELWELRV